ncbi:MAG: PorV/PorQ family protein [candidate division Zixibacteria bacterium]|nr:PorV/PorQ family protein [candidate division Zixibacteria bacterium]
MKRVLYLGAAIALFFLTASETVRASLRQAGALSLRISTGTRPAGMGDAFVGLADDYTATHFNPAGLGRYPMSPDWITYSAPAGRGPIRQLALLRNNVPEQNYKRYDIWAVVGNELFRWDGVQWVSGTNHQVQGSETLEGIVSRWVKGGSEGVTPERLAELILRVAEANNKFTLADLLGIKNEVLAALPPDFVDSEKEKLAEAFDRLVDQFTKTLATPSGLLSLATLCNRALEDQIISVQEASNILAACKKVTGTAMPDNIFLPYNVAFTDSVVAIAGDERVLWVATQSGVFRFDGESWNSYGGAEALPSGPFQYLTVSPARTVWLSNDRGIFSLSGGRWGISESEGGFPAGGVKKMAFAGERAGWAISDSDLYFYDGKKWSNRHEMTAGVSPDLEKMINRFVPGLDSTRMAAAVAEVRRINGLGDSAVATGRKIYLPYRLAFPAPLTALAVDPLQVLWVGTEAGVWRFAEGEFTRFGYQLFTVTREKTILEVARKYTRDSNLQRLARWIERVKNYNQLESDDVFPGQRLWLYAGPAGSRITSIYANSDVAWLGTEFGILSFDKKEFGRYEPAGLARVPTVDVHFKGADGFFATANQVTVYARPWRLMGLMHSNWLPELATDLFFDSPGYVQHFPGLGTFGLHITYLNLGENVRISETEDTLGTFPSFEGSIGLSFGTRLSRSLAFGWTGKFILSKLADFGAGKEKGKGQGTSFALDAGLLYQTPIKRLTFGAALTNLGPKIQYIDAAQADPLPRNLALGFSYRILESAYNRLTFLADFNRDLVSRDKNKTPFKSVFDESIENFGLEYWYGSYFAGRAGYVYDPDGQLKYITLGTSLQYRNFRFDLAYIPSSKNLALANTLRLALVGKF